ncbi:hypothetical protein V9T40_002502 [Parthenolecanium corni]|uniref:Uncharacterized protein n=1 Tax=Parthenolecanium corni TaxID=536013 RepID=A0AAN9TIJ6_9HEMI
MMLVKVVSVPPNSDKPSGERRNSIINIPPPYRPLIPNRFTNVVIKNLNDIDNVTIPPTFTSLTPVSVNPAVISSLCVVLGEQNTNLKPNNSKTTQVNSSSAMATSKDNEKSSESSAKATRDKPPLVVELSGSETDTDFEVDKYDKMPAESNSSVPAQSNSSATTETHSSTPTNANSSALTKNNSSTPTPMETNSSMPSKTNSKINEDQSVLSQDDENSNYSVDGKYNMKI